MVAPMVLLLGLIFVAPIVRLLATTLDAGAGGGAGLYRDVLGDPFFQRALVRTFRVAAITTLVTLLIGYATAYAMWRSGRLVRGVMIALVLFPLFTSVILRTYGWTAMFQRFGVVNSWLTGWGLTEEPLQMLATEWAVLIGMVQVMLPFAVLPIYNALNSVDDTLLRASAMCGARPLTTFRRVTFPLTKPGTIVAGVLVFVVSIGFYVTPAILGGPRTTMVAQAISREVLQFLNVPGGGVMALVLLLATLVVLAVVHRFIDIGKILREGS
jgi:putative spermidine/putrescine transport system permease protein